MYAASTTLPPGELPGHRCDDLLHLLLIASDNAAARALARVSPWGSVGFVARMNEKADGTGPRRAPLRRSVRPATPTNVSSAYDMARLIAYAVDRRAHLRRSCGRRSTRVTLGRRPDHDPQHQPAPDARRPRRTCWAAKTGFISQSGYCLATLLRLPQVNQQVAVVVLGARSNAGRFSEMRNLFNWLSGRAQELLGKKEDQQ